MLDSTLIMKQWAIQCNDTPGTERYYAEIYLEVAVPHARDLVEFYEEPVEHITSYTKLARQKSKKPACSCWNIQKDFIRRISMLGTEVSDSEHMTGIRIEFLKPTGQGYGTLQMQRYNKLLREIPYPASDGKTVFEQCGTKMIISYISPGGSSNGLYARYSRAIILHRQRFLVFVIVRAYLIVTSKHDADNDIGDNIGTDMTNTMVTTGDC
ncbi:hypothetical protein ANCCEY_13606 [Ancylostoma ceylanicum]|uniref:M02D8-5-like seventh CUB domain-containing protein n=1 Tax=Ancylostoma ceylanicum TaxID=53326 RepID=A0A0D6LBW8_9BILA|nr:hypothetical protein ANCCEY_13606 [Ancylostoma ceylanicum]